MKQSVVVRPDNQTPRLEQTPRRAVASAGDDAIAWAESIGWSKRRGRGFYKLDAWQKFCIRGILSEDASARLCASVALLLVPRQNGKNVVLEVVELYAFFVLELRYILHTAHLAETSADHMDRLWEAIQSDKRLRSSCRRVVANGKERIYSTEDGAPPDDEDDDEDDNPLRRTIRFRTRSKKIGRGGSPQMAVFDEALHLTDRQQAGTLPSLSAQSAGPDKPILIYTSSAPVEVEEAEVLLRIRAAILAGDMPDAWFAEWSVEPESGIDWDEALQRMIADKAGWFAANPGMPERIDPDWVDAVERPTMSPEAFAIERLGLVIDTGPAGGPINPARWALLADKDSMATDDTIRLCLDAPPELTSATFSIAGVRADGLLHGSVRHHVQASKLTELVATAKKLCDGHGVDLILPPNSPARAWKPDMLAAGVPLDEMTGPEYAEACGNIRVKVAEGGIRHRGQPDLSAAIDGLAVHRSGDLEVWARRSSKSNIAPFVALTCALHRVPVPSEESAFVSLILGG